MHSSTLQKKNYTTQNSKNKKNEEKKTQPPSPLKNILIFFKQNYSTYRG